MANLTPAHLAELSEVLVAEEDLEVLAQAASSAARLPMQEASGYFAANYLVTKAFAITRSFRF